MGSQKIMGSDYGSNISAVPLLYSKLGCEIVYFRAEVRLGAGGESKGYISKNIGYNSII
jgi:hypothetical protein